jgi:hypothetical protein
LVGHHQRCRRVAAEIFLEDRLRDAEDRPDAAHRRGEALHPELPQDACPEARWVVAQGLAASADATPEIFGCLAECPQASVHRRLSPQARTEPQPPDVAQQERRAVQELRAAHHSESHRELPDATAHRVSGQPLTGQRTARQEQSRDAAAEQHRDEQRRAQLSEPWQFQREARRQQVSER